MTDNECPADSRRRHVLRLALFAGILLGLFYLVAVARVIHVDGVRSAIVVATGPIAPLAYVVVSAALGALFVPPAAWSCHAALGPTLRRAPADTGGPWVARVAERWLTARVTRAASVTSPSKTPHAVTSPR